MLPYNASGAISGIDDRAVVSVVVKALKELANIGGTFKENLIAWLADAANGITDFFARRGHFQEQLCVGDTCVTPEQFKAVFGNSQPAAASAADTQTGAATGGPPAREAIPATGTTTSSTSSEPAPSTSDSSPAPEGANDNQPTTNGAHNEPAAPTDEQHPNDAVTEQLPPAEPDLQPANNNTPPPTQLPATGTE